MNRLLPLLILLVATVSTTMPRAQGLPLDVDLDYATFLYDESVSVLEFYVSVGAEKLDFELTEGQYLATVPLDFVLRPVADSAPTGASLEPVLEENLILRFASVDTSALLPGQFYVEQLRMVVPAGEYTLDATFSATAGRPEVKVALDVVVPDYTSSERVMVSGITLASHITQAGEGDSENRFYKNGLLVTPNPNGLYGEGQDHIFYYMECYGLPEKILDDEYTLFVFLSESNLPQPMSGYQERTVRSVRHPDVLVGSFDISELPSGSYFLRFALLDDNNQAVVEQGKKFFVLNPNVERPVRAVDEGFETSLYAVMSEEEVEDNLAHARVIATQSELSQIRRLSDLEAKRTYLARFWQARDTDSDLASNAARREFYERLRYADDRYDTPFEEVWETDRARVLLKYGYPSDVDPRPFDRQLVPHEIWVFDNIPGQGTSLFIFADREGLGRFDLIHSTVTGEISEPNWQQLLQR